MGTAHSIVLTQDGRVYMSGSNEDGQFNLDQYTASSSTPNLNVEMTAIFPETIVQIGAVGTISYFVSATKIYTLGMGWCESTSCLQNGSMLQLITPVEFSLISKIRFFPQAVVIVDVN